jgi:acyl-CoA thioesterase
MDWTMDWTMDVHRPAGFSICAKTWTMDDFYLATAVSTNSVSGYHFVTIDILLNT